MAEFRTVVSTEKIVSCENLLSLFVLSHSRWEEVVTFVPFFIVVLCLFGSLLEHFPWEDVIVCLIFVLVVYQEILSLGQYFQIHSPGSREWMKNTPFEDQNF